MVGRYHGAHLGGIVQRVAYLHLGGECPRRSKKIVGNVLVDDQAGACIATFAGIEEAAEHGCIRRRFEIADNALWRTAGREFRLACESRYVDCAGIETFAEDLGTTRQIYEADPTLPKDIPFVEAWATVQAAVELFMGFGIIPFAFPIPEGHFQLAHAKAE